MTCSCLKYKYKKGGTQHSPLHTRRGKSYLKYFHTWDWSQFLTRICLYFLQKHTVLSFTWILTTIIPYSHMLGEGSHACKCLYFNGLLIGKYITLKPSKYLGWGYLGCKRNPKLFPFIQRFTISSICPSCVMTSKRKSLHNCFDIGFPATTHQDGKHWCKKGTIWSRRKHRSPHALELTLVP